MLEAVLLPKKPSTSKPLGPGGFLINVYAAGTDASRRRVRYPSVTLLVLRPALRTILTFAAVASASLTPARAGQDSELARAASFVESYQGFCLDGFYYRDASDFKKAPQNHEVWGSFCGPGDRDGNTGFLKTKAFPAPATLQLYLAGYPSRAGLDLKLERQSDGSTLPLEISSLPHESWRLYQFSVPSSWQGQTVRLLAEDRAVTSGGWFALTRPEPGKDVSRSSQATAVLQPWALSFLLIALTFYAGCFLAAQLGCGDVVLVGLSGLTAIGLSGFLAFWLWFFSPSAGRWSNLLVPCFLVLYLLVCFRKLDGQMRQALKELSLPLLLAGATALLVLSTGFLYGGLEDPFETAGARFSHQLPPDNTIPYLFAEGLVNGHVKRPLLADWLSSDRPPLQTGLYLTQRRFFVHELPYTVVSVVVQSLWILSLCLLLRAFRVDRWAAGLILAVCLFHGFVFLNDFYTWPKLLAATYLVGFATVLLSPDALAIARRRWPVGALTGAMLSLSMLSHGGSMFAIAGAVLAYLVLRRALDLKFFAIILFSAFALYLPWMLYQKFYEPPGDRLLKYHLAGVEPIDSRSFGQVVTNAYGKLTFRDWASGRIENLTTVVDHQFEYWHKVGALVWEMAYGDSGANVAIARNALELRAMDFFYLFPCMGPLLLAAPALVIGFWKRAATEEWRAALALWLTVAGTIGVWCLLMFKPGSTVNHQGTYALVLLFIAASILTLWAVSHRLAILVSSASIALNVLLYVVLMRRSPAGDGLQDNSLDYGFLTFAILALILIGVSLSKMPQPRAEDASLCARRTRLPGAAV